jgi:hypothetical protein
LINAKSLEEEFLHDKLRKMLERDDIVEPVRKSCDYGPMTTEEPGTPILTAVPGCRMSEKEAEQAALDLVRAMGEGDIVEGLGKLEMLQVLDDMRCDWMEVLQHGLPELEKGLPQARVPKLVKKSGS